MIYTYFLLFSGLLNYSFDNNVLQVQKILILIKIHPPYLFIFYLCSIIIIVIIINVFSVLRYHSKSKDMQICSYVFFFLRVLYFLFLN